MLGDFNSPNSEKITALTHQFDVYKERHTKLLHEKINIYQGYTDLLCDFLVDIDTIVQRDTDNKDYLEKFNAFDRKRLKAYCRIAMIASQDVMDAQDQCGDYLFDVCEGKKVFDWKIMRTKGIYLLNPMRKDLGFDTVPISYNGTR